MIIYKKNNNNIIYRACKCKPTYNKGDKTSMGWVVVDIQRLYNGKAYSSSDYDSLLSRRFKLRSVIAYVDTFKWLKYIIYICVLYYLFVK